MIEWIKKSLARWLEKHLDDNVVVYEKTIETLKNTVDFLGNTNADLNAKLNTFNREQIDVKSLKDEVQQYEKKLSQAQKKASELEKELLEKNALTSEKNELLKQIDELTTALNRANQYKTMQDTLQQKYNALLVKHDQCRAQTANLEAQTEKNTTLTNTIKNKQTEIDQLNEMLQKERETRQALETKIQVYDVEMSRLRENYQKLLNAHEGRLIDLVIASPYIRSSQDNILLARYNSLNKSYQDILNTQHNLEEQFTRVMVEREITEKAQALAISERQKTIQQYESILNIASDEVTLTKNTYTEFEAAVIRLTDEVQLATKNVCVIQPTVAQMQEFVSRVETLRNESTFVLSSMKVMNESMKNLTALLPEDVITKNNITIANDLAIEYIINRIAEIDKTINTVSKTKEVDLEYADKLNQYTTYLAQERSKSFEPGQQVVVVDKQYENHMTKLYTIRARWETILVEVNTRKQQIALNKDPLLEILGLPKTPIPSNLLYRVKQPVLKKIIRTESLEVQVNQEVSNTPTLIDQEISTAAADAAAAGPD